MTGARRRRRPVKVERSIAQVRRPGDDTPAGLAFALDRRHVVTCAHVVNEALGRDLLDASPPPAHRLVLDFQLAADGPHDEQPTRYGTVVAWRPVEDRRFECRDIAVLALGEKLPAGLVVGRLGFGRTSGQVSAYGPQSARTNGVYVRGRLMGEVERDRLYVDQALSSVFEVAPGFSGGPVWLPETGLVIGVLQARGVGGGRSGDVYVLGSELVHAAWKEVRAEEGWLRRRLAALQPIGDGAGHADAVTAPGSPRLRDRARHPWLIGTSVAWGVAGFVLYGGLGLDRLGGGLPLLPFRQAGEVAAAVVGLAVAAAAHTTAVVGALVLGQGRGGAKRASLP